MVFDKLFGKFSWDVGVDLGTKNTLVYTPEKGIVINEPSVVAVNTRTDEILAVGEDAKKMVGKTPSHIKAVRPLVDGVISDFEVTEKMIKYFVDKARSESFVLAPRPRMIIGIPLEITEVEKKAVEDAARSAGGREVYLVEEVMAATVGVRLPVSEAVANMVVDIGGGTTEIAVISLGGAVTWKSLNVAGNTFDDNIVEYIREEFNILVGEQVAENIKIKIGSATPLREQLEIEVKGRDLMYGLPKAIMINDSQVREALSKSTGQMIENIKTTLEATPPELIADIYEHGIYLSGGGALLRGLDKEVAQATKIPVRVADDPLTCVIRGIGVLLNDQDLLKRIAVT
jgi:rod shape-determining protein MreB